MPVERVMEAYCFVMLTAINGFYPGNKVEEQAVGLHGKAKGFR